MPSAVDAEPVSVADDIERPAFDLVVDPPDVLADDSRDDELNAPDEPDEHRFNMAVMGLRLAGRSNAVAKLHGEVSREMFSDLWPDVPTEETPITSITNGVHAGTWVAPGMADGATVNALFTML